VRIEIRDLRFSYGRFQVLKDICMEAGPMVTAVIGPNAAGKSTLLKCISGMLKAEGTILLDDRDMKTLDRHDLVKLLSYLPQETGSGAILTVFEAVLLGRMHTLSWRVSDDDLAIVFNVLDDLNISYLAKRGLDELSGGQKKMVSIAQALVREPWLLIMDEPTNALDLRNQMELFELIRMIVHNNQITAIVAMHDLNLAARYAERIVVLKEGEIYSAGDPASVLTEDMLASVYGVEARVTVDEQGIPQVIPLGPIDGSKPKRHRAS
jgi:iron complex transport system ATP-binding protein